MSRAASLTWRVLRHGCEPLVYERDDGCTTNCLDFSWPCVQQSVARDGSHRPYAIYLDCLSLNRVLVTGIIDFYPGLHRRDERWIRSRENHRALLGRHNLFGGKVWVSILVK